MDEARRGRRDRIGVGSGEEGWKGVERGEAEELVVLHGASLAGRPGPT